MPQKKTLEEYEKDSIAVYGDIFDYSNSTYINSRSKILIKCKRCGHEFYRIARDHLLKKYGCPYCNIISLHHNDNLNLEGEIWKDIKGFEGSYKISNKGRIMSYGNSIWKTLSMRNSKGGYLTVRLRRKDGTFKSTRIHRLVYETFIGEIPKGEMFHVHHIDGNKQNNNVNNLILKTPMEHSKEHYIHILETASKRDYGVKDGNINEYCKYIVENGKVVGLNPNYNHKHKHKNKYNQIKSEKEGKVCISYKPRKIEQYTLDGIFINSYNNAKDAERKTGVCSRNILQVANKEPYNNKGSVRKQAGGYVWRFLE